MPFSRLDRVISEKGEGKSADELQRRCDILLASFSGRILVERRARQARSATNARRPLQVSEIRRGYRHFCQAVFRVEAAVSACILVASSYDIPASWPL